MAARSAGRSARSARPSGRSPRRRGRHGGLLGGTIGTFDTLFEHLARGQGPSPRLVGDAERGVLVRRLSAGTATRGARFAGFADAVGRALAELDGALLEPGE